MHCRRSVRPSLGGGDAVGDSSRGAGARRATRGVRLARGARISAARLGVDPATLLGRGSGGRVTRDDVRAASGTGDGRDRATRSSRSTTSGAAPRPALLASKRTIPHALRGRRGRLRRDRRGAPRRRARPRCRSSPGPSIDALREFPLHERDDRPTTAPSVVLHRAVHLGIAVDLDFQGLVVPVVHDADGLRLRALAAAIRDVAAPRPRPQARPRRPRGRDVHDHQPRRVAARGSRSRSSTGRRSGSSRPTACRSRSSSTTTAGSRIAPLGHLCCAFDHRALDGAYAGAFVARVREIVETRDWLSEL